jgi:hypothetical protein
MIEKEHRTRDGTFVEPGELAAKERQHARRGGGRATPTTPLPVIPPKESPTDADADPVGEGDPPPA